MRTGQRIGKGRAALAGAGILVFGTGGLGVVHAAADAPVSAEVLAGATAPDRFTIKAKGPSEIAVVKVTIAPGASAGWHYHPGSVIVTVTSGTATFYRGDDPSCQANRLSAGDARVESPGDVHITRNEGATPLEFFFTSITPAGSPSGVAVPNPGNCPF